ncbi:MAG: hypothetical protein LBU32_04165, partial [Clostridiales bacterium]|nr:hypothetical protein [Clostridiales bacterium]
EINEVTDINVPVLERIGKNIFMPLEEAREIYLRDALASAMGALRSGEGFEPPLGLTREIMDALSADPGITSDEAYSLYQRHVSKG